MTLRLSPKYDIYSFKWPLTLDSKILIFEDQVNGWTLDIIDQMVNGKQDESGELVIKPIPSSEHVALAAILSHFEMIGKCLPIPAPAPGVKLEAGAAFKEGIKYYFKHDEALRRHDPATQQISVAQLDAMLKDMQKIMYSVARNGLYHSNQLDVQLVFNPWQGGSLQYTAPQGPHPMTGGQFTQITINMPHFITEIKQHFAEFVIRLKDQNETALRSKFEAMFNGQYKTLLTLNPPQIVELPVAKIERVE